MQEMTLLIAQVARSAFLFLHVWMARVVNYVVDAVKVCSHYFLVFYVLEGMHGRQDQHELLLCCFLIPFIVIHVLRTGHTAT